MSSNTLADVVVRSAVHGGGLGFGTTGMPGAGLCTIPGYPTAVRVRTAAAVTAKADNDAWGFLTWSPPV